MADAAFKTAAFPGYTTAELRERVSAYEFWELAPDKVDAMRAEIERRERVERGEKVMANVPDMVRSLKVAKKHYRWAINALGRSYRSGKGTATAQAHRDDYERHLEIAERAMDAAIAKTVASLPTPSEQ